MLDRRFAIATLAAALFVFGAIFVPQAFTAHDLPLEATAASGPIPSAIDAGAANSLAGLLPTSEAYQRVTDVVDGLKSGIPTSAPSLSTSQLDDIKAIAEGAAQGVLASSPNSITTSGAKTAIHALAAGYMRGAIGQLAASPSAGRAAVDDAATKGLFTGAIGLFVTADTFVPASTWDEYGYTLANGLFDQLDAHGAAFASIAGSPAIGDITFFTTAFARESLADIPVSIAKQQVDAVATFAAGALDGTITGTITSFPQGMPLPAQSDVSRWMQALATGHDGTPPWQKPGSLPLLLAWGDAVGAAAIDGLAQARKNVTGTTPPGSLDDLSAWGDGLTSGAFTKLQSLPGYTPEIESDVRAYAEGVTAPGVAWITGFAHPNADPDVVKAWAFGLAGGLGDVVAATPRAFGLTDEYLSNLTSAITAFPPSAGGAQVAIVQGFAEGVTAHLTARMTNVSNAAVSPDDPTIIGLMAQSMADDAAKFAAGAPLSDPQLAQALGNGLSSGFLDSKDPRDLWNGYDAIKGAARAWWDAGPPVSLTALNDMAQGAVRDPYYAAQQFGEMIGQAPLDWSTAKGQNVTAQGWGGVNDLFWLSAFTGQLVTDLGGSFGTGVPDLGVDAAVAYAQNVTDAVALTPHVLEGVHNVTTSDSDFQQHARAFTDYVMAPAGWLAADPSNASVEAASAVLAQVTTNASLDRFKDSDYASAALGAIDALSNGIIKGGSGPDTPPWADGVVAAIDAWPEGAITGANADISARLVWITDTAAAVGPVAKNATHVEYHAVKRFANEAATWALGAPDRIPSTDGLPTPLVTWANASVAAGLAALPTGMTQAEVDAAVAYLMGIQTAIAALPAPDPAHWTLLDTAAVSAYVGGIASGVAQVQNDTITFLCTANVGVNGSDAGAPGCPDNGSSGGGNDTGGNGGGGNGGGCTSDCPPECIVAPGTPSAPNEACEAKLWADAVEAWSNGLTAGGLQSLSAPDITPTQHGVALVAAWATDALGRHGLCPPSADPGFTCDPAGGPIAAFVGEEKGRIDLATKLISDGAGALVSLPNGPPQPTDLLSNPVLSWASGLTTGIGTLISGAPPTLPAAPPTPGTPGATAPPTGDITDPSYRAALQAWSDSLWQVPGEVYAGAIPSLPDTAAINATFGELQYFFADSIWKGGGDAILDSPDAVVAVARNATPDVALDAWAQGLAQGVKATLVDPTPDDINALLQWYAGLAHGGVDAILTGADSVQNGQIPALQAYAAAMGQAYTPPAPQFQEITDLTSPPDPQDVTNGTSSGGDGGSGSGGGSGGGDQTPPSGEAPSDYLTIVQADAQGLAEAALHAPSPGALSPNATAYQQQFLTYLTSVIDAASALPPTSTDAGFPAQLAAWVNAEATAAMAKQPTSADRIGPSPNVALAQAYVLSFASASPWSLDNASVGGSSWAGSAIAAGLNAACPPGDSASTCAAIGTALGEGLGKGIPSSIPELGQIPTPDQLSFVSTIITSSLPQLPVAPPSVGAQAVLGLTAGLAQAGPTAPNAAAAAQATMTAVGPTLDTIPFVAVRPTVEGIVEVLARSQDPARYQALASGAAALVSGMGDKANDPAAVQQAIASYLATGGSAEPIVSASDGTRTRTGDALDGSPIFDGEKPIVVTVYPSSSAPLDATWQLRWSTSDPTASDAHTVAMSGSNGAFSATLTPDAIASLARGAKIAFAIAETRAGSTAMHTRGSSPFAFVPDRDAPAATLTAALASSGISVSWAGTDGDSMVASYHVDSRDGQGAWTPWINATSDPSATFSGAPGHSYTFQVTPTDAVGHVGAAASSAAVAIPASAPADHAPTITITAPASGSVFGKSIPVSVSASDPDGTTPIVKLCLRKEGASSDLPCAYEGKPSAVTIDASALPDGRYRLHAIATDGSMSADTTSAAFAIDRTPPVFRGAVADATAARVILSASLDRDASGVTVDIGGRTLALADDGKGADARAADGIWSAMTTLAPGEYTALFRAHDANGNDATLSKDVIVPAPVLSQPKPGGTTTTPPTSAPPTATPTAAPAPAKKGTPPIGLAPALAALAALALALRRRR